jgi:hypothetical protein
MMNRKAISSGHDFCRLSTDSFATKQPSIEVLINLLIDLSACKNAGAERGFLLQRVCA